MKKTSVISVRVPDILKREAVKAARKDRRSLASWVEKKLAEAIGREHQSAA